MEIRKNLFIFFIIIFAFLFSFSGLNAQIIILGNQLITHEVVPGSTYRSTIQIKNAFNENKRIKVYQTEYKSTCENGQEYPLNLENQKFPSNKKWIKFSPEVITIPPGGISRINLEVNVPNDSNLFGSFISMIMAEEDISGIDLGKGVDLPSVTPKKLPDRRSQKLEIKTIQNVRYGFQIISNVITKPSNAELVIKNIKLYKSRDNHRELQFDVDNNGYKLIKTDAYAELFNSSTGFRISHDGKERYYSNKMTLAPFSCARFKIDLGILPLGAYKIQIIIDSGDEAIWGQQFNIKIN